MLKLIVLLIARKIEKIADPRRIWKDDGMKGGDVGERGEEAIHCSGSGWGKGCGHVIWHFPARVCVRLDQLRGWMSK